MRGESDRKAAAENPIDLEGFSAWYSINGKRFVREKNTRLFAIGCACVLLSYYKAYYCYSSFAGGWLAYLHYTNNGVAGGTVPIQYT